MVVVFGWVALFIGRVQANKLLTFFKLEILTETYSRFNDYYINMLNFKNLTVLKILLLYINYNYRCTRRQTYLFIPIIYLLLFIAAQWLYFTVFSNNTGKLCQLI